jgi:hypothetical protein
VFVQVPIPTLPVQLEVNLPEIPVTYLQLACDEVCALKAPSTPYLLSAGKCTQGEENEVGFHVVQFGGSCCLDVIGSCKGRDVA